MRFGRLFVLLALALPVHAGERWEDVAPDPAAVCPNSPPIGGMIQVMGVAPVFLSKAAALDAAWEDGVRRMVEERGAGFGAAALEAVRRNTHAVNGAGSIHKGWACVPMALPVEERKHLERAGEELDRQVRSLAAKLAAEAKGRTIDLRPATQGESGAVSQVSDSIRGLLLGFLPEGAGVRILEPGTWEPDSIPLTIQLTPNKVEIVGTVQLDGVPLGGLRFPLDLYRLTPGETDAPIPVAGASVGGKDQPGSSGLRVRVDPPAPSGIACEGDVVELVAHTKSPARVRLYSVNADGTTYLLWPPSPGYESANVPKGTGPTGDQIVGELRLPGSTMIPSPDRQDERMVLVAVPPGVSFGAAENWRGFCEVSGGFSEQLLLPKGAAVSYTSFNVRPSEATGCLLTEAVESARVSAAEAIVGQAQLCR